MLDLAIKAGARALALAGGRTVQAVLVAPTSPEPICPAVAPEVASALGRRRSLMTSPLPAASRSACGSFMGRCERPVASD